MSSSSIVVQASIVHQVIKEIRQRVPIEPLIRDNLHDHSDQVVKLIDFLDEQLEKNGLAHSTVKSFEDYNTLGYVVKNFLFDQYLISNIPFITHTCLSLSSVDVTKIKFKLCQVKQKDFPSNITEPQEVLDSETSEQTIFRRVSALFTTALHYHIYKEDMTTGDHLPIIFYRKNNTNFLYIALLSLTDNITIDETTGEILDIKHIDSNKLKVACNINLDELRLHSYFNSKSYYKPKDYVAWIQKGKAKKIDEYIQDFLPVSYRIDDKKSTNKLMKALEAYLQQSPLPDGARKEIHKDTLSLLRQKAKSKSLINITEDIDPIIQNKAAIFNITLANNDTFKSFRMTSGYGPNDANNSNIFAPEEGPLDNYEMFDFIVGEGGFIKISGKQSMVGSKIVLNDDDLNNPYLMVPLTSDELIKAQKVFDNARRYESSTREDTNTPE